MPLYGLENFNIFNDLVKMKLKDYIKYSICSFTNDPNTWLITKIIGTPIIVVHTIFTIPLFLWMNRKKEK